MPAVSSPTLARLSCRRSRSSNSMTALRSVNRQIAPWSLPASSAIGEIETPRWVAAPGPNAGSSLSVRRPIGRRVERHSSIASTSGDATIPSSSRNDPAGSRGVTPSRRRPAGVEDSHVAAHTDHEQAGGETRDDLLAQPLGGLGALLGGPFLRADPRHGLLQRGREKRRLGPRVTLTAVGRTGRPTEADQREQQHRTERGDDQAEDQEERVGLWH